MPKFSIVTVCRNEAKRIRNTIDSVLSQDYGDFEWIVIDGASTDGTKEILDSYKHRITSFVSEPDSGVYSAQNKGLQNATGDFVLFLNGGDELADSQVLHRTMECQPNKNEILYGDLITLSEEQGEVRHIAPNKIDSIYLMNTTIWHPSTFIARNALLEAGGFNEDFKIAADYDFFLCAFKSGRFRMRHLPFAVAKFWMDGLSSLPENQMQLLRERTKSQDANFHPFFLKPFRLYKALRNLV